MISIIAALSENYVIGNGPRIPWHIPEDFKQFKEKTLGNVLIMGRATYDAIGKPLPKRTTIVLSRHGFNQEGIIPARDLAEALELAEPFGKEIFIAGGGHIYRQALDAGIVEKMYLSHVKGTYDGDVFFPRFDEKEWIVSETVPYDQFDLKVYDRK